MTKNQKMLLGVAAVGVAAYLVWDANRKKGFVNAVGAVKCPSGFKSVSVWTNYPNEPKSTSMGCFNSRTNSFFYPTAM